MKRITESDVRLLRAKCYNEISNEGWENVKEHWMEPHNIEWLKVHAQIEPTFKGPFVVPEPQKQ